MRGEAPLAASLALWGNTVGEVVPFEGIILEVVELPGLLAKVVDVFLVTVYARHTQEIGRQLKKSVWARGTEDRDPRVLAAYEPVVAQPVTVGGEPLVVGRYGDVAGQERPVVTILLEPLAGR